MKIGVKQVLSEAMNYWRRYFKKLAMISFFMFLLNVFVYVLFYIPLEEAPLGWVPIIVIMAFLMIIFLPKHYMAVRILFYSMMYENDMTIKQAYRQTKRKYWRWWGYLLIIILPALVLMIIGIPFANIISVIFVSFARAFIYALSPMIAIEEKPNISLKKSIKMIKGNYLPILVIVIITATSLSVVSAIFSSIFRTETIEYLVFGMAFSIAYFFIFPFVAITEVVVYAQLKEKHTLHSS